MSMDHSGQLRQEDKTDLLDVVIHQTWSMLAREKPQRNFSYKVGQCQHISRSTFGIYTISSIDISIATNLGILREGTYFNTTLLVCIQGQSVK